MGGACTDRAPREAVRWPGDVIQAPGTGSPHKNSRSCISWYRASATERWQPSCFSARGRSTSTCATSSGSLISVPAPNSPVSISRLPANRRWRPGNRRFRRREPRHPSYGRCRGVSVPPTRANSRVWCLAVWTPTSECATVVLSLRNPNWTVIRALPQQGTVASNKSGPALPGRIETSAFGRLARH